MNQKHQMYLACKRTLTVFNKIHFLKVYIFSVFFNQALETSQLRRITRLTGGEDVRVSCRAWQINTTQLCLIIIVTASVLCDLFFTQ